MYRFSLHTTDAIKSEYLKLFSNWFWRKKAQDYAAVVQRNSCLSFLSGKSYNDLLIAPFDTLTEIYYNYVAVKSSLSISDQNLLTQSFRYDSKKRKIAHFIESYNLHLANGTTCPYCDATFIRLTSNRKGGRNYELDHYLDKAVCPLVALSLYNLVPVCPDCNGAKGANTFGNTIAETIALSPFNAQYNFDGDVRFKIRPESLEDILRIRSTSAYKNYKISIEPQHTIYDLEISITDILSRFYSPDNPEYNELMDFCSDVESMRSKMYDLIDGVFHTQRRSKFHKLSTVEQRKKGIRVRYDKFKRDILKQL